MSAEYNSVRQIASVCYTHDTQWRDSLTERKQEEAIKECAARVEKLTTARIRCGTLVFEKVRLREIKKEKEKPIFTKLGVTVDTRLTANDARIYPLSQKEVQFYLLFDDSIIHVEMSPKYQKIANLYLLTPNLVWDVSSSQIEAMVKENWDRSFVTARYNWDLVVPIPGVRGEEEKKCDANP
jgi:hypothetical protein